MLHFCPDHSKSAWNDCALCQSLLQTYVAVKVLMENLLSTAFYATNVCNLHHAEAKAMVDAAQALSTCIVMAGVKSA